MTAEAWTLIVLLSVLVPVYTVLTVLTFRAQKRADAAYRRKWQIINEMMMEAMVMRRMREMRETERVIDKADRRN